jgi:hypothetical protein
MNSGGGKAGPVDGGGAARPDVECFGNTLRAIRLGLMNLIMVMVHP